MSGAIIVVIIIIILIALAYWWSSCKTVCRNPLIPPGTYGANYPPYTNGSIVRVPVQQGGVQYNVQRSLSVPSGSFSQMGQPIEYHA